MVSLRAAVLLAAVLSCAVPLAQSQVKPATMSDHNLPTGAAPCAPPSCMQLSVLQLGTLAKDPIFPRPLPLQECDTTFLDALEGFDTFIFREGLQLAGFEDQLPSPDIGVTILVPTNKAWTSFLFRNGALNGWCQT